MKVTLKTDDKLDPDELIIYSKEINKEMLALKERIEHGQPQVLTGFYDDRLEFIDPDDIIRVYANEKKVYAVTIDKVYTLRLALYQVEERLDEDKFIRISNSEIINIRKTKNFDLSYIGTISCEMINGDVCFVSKRSLKKVKKTLGI